MWNPRQPCWATHPEKGLEINVVVFYNRDNHSQPGTMMAITTWRKEGISIPKDGMLLGWVGIYNKSFDGPLPGTRVWLQHVTEPVPLPYISENFAKSPDEAPWIFHETFPDEFPPLEGCDSMQDEDLMSYDDAMSFKWTDIPDWATAPPTFPLVKVNQVHPRSPTCKPVLFSALPGIPSIEEDEHHGAHEHDCAAWRVFEPTKFFGDGELLPNSIEHIEKIANWMVNLSHGLNYRQAKLL